ncbi:Response regulator receiver domain protein CheY [Nostoc sp. NIES-3756]|nr:Response regulator receiver domain protein CheY [Nostoc sp. NIES-3756]
MSKTMINILLVEDDEVDVMNVKRAFKKVNITNPIYIGSNGLEALTILRGNHAQFPNFLQERRLVLLNLNMPKVGSIEF